MVKAKQGKELNQENNKSQTIVVDYILYDVTVCVPYVASFSGLSIFDCPFGMIKRLLILNM
jgi:hypothetical protein